MLTSRDTNPGVTDRGNDRNDRGDHGMRLVRRYQIPLFYVLAFALSWLVWGSEIAAQRHLLPFALPDLLAYAGVGLAAFITAGLAGGRAGMLDLVRRIVRWRVGWRWYAVALGVPLAITLTSAGIYRLLGGSVALGQLVSVQEALAYFALALPVFLLSEETAWRGFALPRLEARYSALAASLIVGVLWGIWHTPLFFMASAAQSNAPYLVFVLSTVAQSILFAWVFNNSGGSVLVMALMHTVTNTVMAFVGVGPGDVRAFVLMTGVMWAAALIVVLLAGPRRLVRGTSGAFETAVYPPEPEQERDRAVVGS